jgi:uncharacterized OB-fold protein
MSPFDNSPTPISMLPQEDTLMPLRLLHYLCRRCGAKYFAPPHRCASCRGKAFHGIWG